MAATTLSTTDRPGKMLVIWKERPTPARTSSLGGSPSTRRPSRWMVPVSGRYLPERMLNRVVFPAPLGPMMARSSPRGTCEDTPSTARTPPKCLRTSSTTSMVDRGRCPLVRTNLLSPAEAAPQLRVGEGAHDSPREEQDGQREEHAHEQGPVFGV